VFGSTVVSFRAESAPNTYSGANTAAGIDAAVASGARVINISLGTTAGSLGPTFEAALQRAVDAGVIVVAAAGNDATDAAHWPSGYSVDPRYAGLVVGVGALNASGGIASFSNRASAAGGGFLFAPGEAVVSNCTAASCLSGSGTSFAAPHVSGGAALLLQVFPNMSGRQVVDLMFHTARDLGAPGNDPVYGWGALDLARAFAPVGPLSIPTGATLITESFAPGSTIGAAFGDAVQTTSALQTVGWDHYQRPFQTDLGRVYGGISPSILSPASSDVMRRSEVEVGLAGGARLNLSAAATEDWAGSATDRFRWMPSETRRDVVAAYRNGPLGVMVWSGKAAGNPLAASNPDPFIALAQSDRAVRADYELGRWALSAEAGAGERRSVDLLQREDGARYGRVSATTLAQGARHTVSFGGLDEPMGPLGAFLPSGGGLALPARTTFASWNAVWPLDGGFAVETQASVGHTRLSGAVMRLEEAALSSAWKASVRGPCAALRLACSQVRFSVAQPLRVESGRFSARLADPLADYFAPVTYSVRRFDAAPSGREIDVSLGVSRSAGWAGVVSLDAVAALQPGHRAAEDPAYGVLLTWRTGR
jgi:hypothetical protein